MQRVSTAELALCWPPREDSASMTREQIQSAFLRYGPMVLYRAKILLGNEAEANDVVQEVFIKALSHSKRKEAFLASWLRRVTVNLCLNRIRDRRRRRELERQHLNPQPARAARFEEALALRDLLQQVDVRCAQAAICIYVDGMSHAEAAKELAVSRRTIGNLLQRFRHAAQTLLAQRETNPNTAAEQDERELQ